MSSVYDVVKHFIDSLIISSIVHAPLPPTSLKTNLRHKLNLVNNFLIVNCDRYKLCLIFYCYYFDEIFNDYKFHNEIV